MPDSSASLHSPVLDGSRADRLEAELADAGARLAASRRELEELHEALHAADARERVLSNELQHRVRNMLGVIRSIYRRTLESGASQDEFAEHFEGRLNAITRYQAEIAGVTTEGVELEDMVRDELLAVRCIEGPRCRIAGPSVRLHAKRIELMSLALHELTTNAIKFGALFHDGTLLVEWSLAETPAGTDLHLLWKETGVALVSSAPRSEGFGQDLIEEALPYQLGATTSFQLKPGGLECAITLPLHAA